MARGDLSDVEWELVEPFLPLGGRGPVPDLRRLFNAVMWRFRTGRPWRDVPQEYGSWSTVYGAFQRWAAAGTFRMLMGGMIAEAAARDQVALDLVSVDSTVARAHHHAAGMAVDPELLDELEKAVAEEKGLIERGKAHRWLRRTRTATTWCVRTTKTHLAAERRCRRLSFVLTPGQDADSPRFVPVLEGIKVRGPVGRPRTRPGAVAADKTHSSRANRAYLRRRRIRCVIPEKADQVANRKKKGSRGGRPVAHDPDLYKDRNTVERCINKIKEWRGLATRYDKTATGYLAGLHLRGAVIWIRSLRPT
ncbi:IS5 family transposase [Streptomyces sp. WAC00263]|uniref:IS5 family transposase n=1 Tax=Streptomyces sp. WAC00263 TaxID=1917422 RepID=UPI0015EEC71E|nr:IS5 family transposase [Streptomyces sp. WAC00263]KAF5996986.1 IS5/IS1182 family transposase [Streptomyces sp. WAC00263]